MSHLKWKFFIFFIFVLSLLTGCSSSQVNHSQPICVYPGQKIAVLPFRNMTETPQADERAASITADLLRTKGMNVILYPLKSQQPTLIPGVKRIIPRGRLLAWAREHGAQYAVIGDVTEWNYKVGLDGEPAVGINLELINTYSEHTVWSAVGSKSGGSRTALSEVAVNLLDYMLYTVQLPRK